MGFTGRYVGNASRHGTAPWHPSSGQINSNSIRSSKPSGIARLPLPRSTTEKFADGFAGGAVLYSHARNKNNRGRSQRRHRHGVGKRARQTRPRHSRDTFPGKAVEMEVPPWPRQFCGTRRGINHFRCTFCSLLTGFRVAIGVIVSRHVIWNDTLLVD